MIIPLGGEHVSWIIMCKMNNLLPPFLLQKEDVWIF